MVFNATFNNISVISWQSVFLVEETGVPEETFIYCRDDFSNYIVFNWFRLFSLEYFPMKVGPFEKEVEDGFSYFSLIFSYIIFQIESSLILFCFCLEKFVSDLQQMGGFLWVLRFPPPIKLTTTI